MTKKTKKTEVAGLEDGLYEGFDGQRNVVVELRGGLVVAIDDEKFREPGVSVEKFEANIATIGAKKSAPDATAIAPEAGSNPDEEAQTEESIAKKKNIRKPVLRTLRFPLGPDEIEQKCSGIAKKSRAAEELESELSRVKSDYKGRIEKLQLEIKRDLTAVEEREEPREVMAEEVHDFEAAMVRYEYAYRTYEQREMTPRERQMTIDGVL